MRNALARIGLVSGLVLSLASDTTNTSTSTSISVKQFSSKGINVNSTRESIVQVQQQCDRFGCDMTKQIAVTCCHGNTTPVPLLLLNMHYKRTKYQTRRDCLSCDLDSQVTKRLNIEPLPVLLHLITVASIERHTSQREREGILRDRVRGSITQTSIDPFLKFRPPAYPRPVNSNTLPSR